LSTEGIARSWGPDSGAPQRIECLEEAVRRLVAERQALREVRADREALESNRLEIGRLNRELSGALIAEHLPRAA
jgi:hypothetical protein